MEIDLLKRYPKAKRDLSGRSNLKTDADRTVARKFGKEFFDGARRFGYGGFSYHPRFWQPVIPDLQHHFNIDSSSSLLDVGCAKGFMLYDFMQMIPGVNVAGVDVSRYAIENAQPEVREKLQVTCATNLPFEDNSFDIVISINTIHNLDIDACAAALQEIERVSRGRSFVTVDAYRNEEERHRMEAWNLTAQTVMHVDEWKAFFKRVGYSGDFYWFIP